MSLSEIVERLAGTKPRNSEQTRVKFRDEVPEQQRLNAALANMNDVERIAFLQELIKVWFRVDGGSLTREQALAELHKLLGTNLDWFFGRQIIFTLTANEKQLRCWYGIPSCIRANHADSCGQNDLFQVTGEAEKLRQYADALVGHRQPFKLPNAVTIYLAWEW